MKNSKIKRLSDIVLILAIFSFISFSKAAAKSNDYGCDNRGLALSTFVIGCTSYKSFVQTSKGGSDSFAKQKSDCREISKEFTSLVFGVAPRSCEFTNEPNLIKAILLDKDVRAFSDSL